MEKKINNFFYRKKLELVAILYLREENGPKHDP